MNRFFVDKILIFYHPVQVNINPEERKFQSTHWTLIERASSDDSDVADAAMSEIFGMYWPPLYVFARYKGLSAEDAEDIVQVFFHDLCEKNLLGKACSSKGKLRTFFLTVVERLILQKIRGEMALKRGGGEKTFSIDQAREEQWLNSEPIDGSNPESLYDKRWALSVLEQALLSLRSDYERKGKVALFGSLKSHLGWSEGEESYADIAAQHQLTEGAVRVAVYRLRKKYKETLQSQIADTINSSDSEKIKEEIEYLFAALAGG